MKLRICKWHELSPFAQGWVIGSLKAYAMMTGMAIAWWLLK